MLLCNILNFYLTLMGISPTDYDVTLMFNWYNGFKNPLHINMMIVWYIGRNPIAYFYICWVWTLKHIIDEMFVLREEIWSTWVFDVLCWARSSGKHVFNFFVEWEALEQMSYETFVLSRKFSRTWKYNNWKCWA